MILKELLWKISPSGGALLRCAPVWECHGLTLSPAQCAALEQHQAAVLRETGRVDFGGGALPALALAFYDSPYIQPADWSDTLAALTELFYTLKNETHDQVGDEALAQAMAVRFHESSGSLEGLTAVEPAWYLRFAVKKEGRHGR